MPVYCSASGCSNYRGKKEGLQFFSFPFRREKVFKQWVAALARENFMPSKYATLCSEHFAPDAYAVRPNINVPYLKEDAVPTIFKRYKSEVPQHSIRKRYKKRVLITSVDITKNGSEVKSKRRKGISAAIAVSTKRDDNQTDIEDRVESQDAKQHIGDFTRNDKSETVEQNKIELQLPEELITLVFTGEGENQSISKVDGRSEILDQLMSDHIITYKKGAAEDEIELQVSEEAVATHSTREDANGCVEQNEIKSGLPEELITLIFTGEGENENVAELEIDPQLPEQLDTFDNTREDDNQIIEQNEPESLEELLNTPDSTLDKNESDRDSDIESQLREHSYTPNFMKKDKNLNTEQVKVTSQHSPQLLIQKPKKRVLYTTANLIKRNKDKVEVDPYRLAQLIVPNKKCVLVSATESRPSNVNNLWDIIKMNRKRVRKGPTPTEIELRKKVKILHQKIRRQNKQISRLKGLVQEAKRNGRLGGYTDKTPDSFDGVLGAIFSNELKNKERSTRGHRYSSEMKNFAVTLLCYSPKAYELCRSILQLPHPSSIRNWTSSDSDLTETMMEALNNLENNSQDEEL